MSCILVKYTKKWNPVSVMYAQVCGTDIGEAILYDQNGSKLLSKTGETLIAK